MELTKTYKKPRKSLPTPQKVISFKAFETKEKSKIQLAYPFLSPEQIKGKIKERWNKLSDDEKQLYTTYKLEPTPKTKIGQKDAKGTKRKNRSFPDFFSPKPKAAKFDPKDQVCDTPEYINTRKLTDFRNSHPEIYNNDFSDDSDIVKGSQESSLFPSDGINTYKPHGNIETKLKPMKSKIQTQGILRNSDSAKKACNRAKVSFNSQSEVTTFNTDPDPDQTEGTCELDDFSYIDSSDDEESFLIHREDTEFVTQSGNIAECQGHCDEKGVNKQKQNDNKHGEDDKIATDGKKVNNRVMIDGLDSSGDKLNSMKSKDGCLNSTSSLNLRKRKVETETSKNKELFKSPLPNSTKKTKGSSRKKHAVNTSIKGQTPDMGKIKDHSSSQVTPLMSNKSETPDDYTTPQMDESLQQLTLDQVVKAPQKPRQARKSMDARETVQAQLVARQVNRFLLDKGKTEVKKGKDTKTNKGKKKKAISGKENVKNDAETSEIVNVEFGKECKSNENDSFGTEPSAGGRITRRSNRQKSQACTDQTITINDSDDNSDIRTSRRHEITDQNNNNVNDNDCNVANMNPSGDAGKGVCEKGNVDAEVRDELNDLNEDGQFKAGSSTRQKRYFRRRSRQLALIDGQSLSPTSSSCSSQESKLSSSINNSPKYDGEDTTSFRKKKIVRHNPVLEKALKLLQLTATSSSLNNSPVVSNMDNEEEMDTYSPSLLSPALSGVSELSSASSSLTNPQESCNSLMASQSLQEEGLTQLFTDLTPPEQKTHGLYKTQRENGLKEKLLVVSNASVDTLMLKGSDDRSSVTMTMKEYFSGEADIF